MIPNTPSDGYDFCDFLNYDNMQDLHLYEIGTYKCPPSYSYGPVIRTKSIIHYVYSGEGRLILENQEYKIKGKQGFLIPAGKLAFYEADKKNPWSYCWLHVGGYQLDSILQQIGLSLSSPIYIPKEDNTSFESAFQNLMDARKRELSCIGKLYDLFDVMCTTSQNRFLPESDLQLEYVRRIINFIQLKYSEPLHVTEIAIMCGLDRSYMTRLFKEATGSTIQDYIIQYRIKKAKKLLENTNSSIQHISLSVGYSDIFIFSKAFKKITGFSPSQWRKNMRLP